MSTKTLRTCLFSMHHAKAAPRFGGGAAASPDILVAVDVDSVELMLEVFVLYICHVVDHFQNYKTRQD